MRVMTIKETDFKEKLFQIYKEEEIKILREKFESLSIQEKKIIINFVNKFGGKKQKIVEGVGDVFLDVLGIIDPSGVVDLLHGLNYLKEGDTLFGILTLISAVPLIGDIIGKPVILLMKGGGETARLFRAAKTSNDFVILAKKFPVFASFLKGLGKVSPKILEAVKTVPGGKKILKVINDWIGTEGLLTKAAKEYKIGGTLTKTGTKLSSSELRAFRDYGIKSDWNWFLKFWKKGTFIPYIGKNRQLSKLLGRTKFWLGALDYFGIANFVGPNELIEQMGEENFNQKMGEYMNTPQAKQNWDSEMIGIDKTGISPLPTTMGQTIEKIQPDPFSLLFSIMGGNKMALL